MLQAAADSCQLLQATANGKLKINREGVQHQQLQLYCICIRNRINICVCICKAATIYYFCRLKIDKDE